MPWAGDPRVNPQEGSGGKAKSYQVQQLLAAVDRRRAELAKAAEEAKAAAQKTETESVTKKTTKKKGKRS